VLVGSGRGAVWRGGWGGEGGKRRWPRVTGLRSRRKRGENWARDRAEESPLRSSASFRDLNRQDSIEFDHRAEELRRAANSNLMIKRRIVEQRKSLRFASRCALSCWSTLPRRTINPGMPAIPSTLCCPPPLPRGPSVDYSFPIDDDKSITQLDDDRTAR